MWDDELDGIERKKKRTGCAGIYLGTGTPNSPATGRIRRKLRLVLFFGNPAF